MNECKPLGAGSTPPDVSGVKHPPGSDAAKLTALRKKLVESDAARLSLQVDNAALHAFLAKKHSVCWGSVNDDKDRYEVGAQPDAAPLP